jgi:hypothetical protein
MRRLAKFLSLSLQEKQLFCEAFVLLLLSRICVKIIAFRHIYRFLSALRDETTEQGSCDVGIVKQSILRAATLLPWKSLCLSQSIAAFIMLRRRGVPAVMFIGARFEHSLIDAHAWIQARYVPDIESEEPAYTPLMKIGQELPRPDQAPATPRLFRES